MEKEFVPESFVVNSFDSHMVFKSLRKGREVGFIVCGPDCNLGVKD